MAAQASFVNVRCAVQTFAAENNSAAVISVTVVAAVSCRARDAVENSVSPRIRAAARRGNERRICMDEGYARSRGRTKKATETCDMLVSMTHSNVLSIRAHFVELIMLMTVVLWTAGCGSPSGGASES